MLIFSCFSLISTPSPPDRHYLHDWTGLQVAGNVGEDDGHGDEYRADELFPRVARISWRHHRQRAHRGGNLLQKGGNFLPRRHRVGHEGPRNQDGSSRRGKKPEVIIVTLEFD